MGKKVLSYHSYLILLIGIFFLIVSVSGATTQVHIIRYANDDVTVLNETTKTYQWLEANLPVLGDGVTHYYHQGPVFIDDPDPVVEQELRWNPDEDSNEKDQGAVKGTNIKDLCDLVGGMNAGETLKLRASDGFSKMFAYENVYNYPARQGPMVITWYQNGNYPDGAYSDGMKLVFFADDSVNPWGYQMMGNYDWYESAAPEYWYYYTSGSEQYPTTTGLSVKYISDIFIYSDDAPPAPVAPVAAFSVTPLSGNAPLAVQFTDQSTGMVTTYAWDFNNDGITDSTLQNPEYIYSTAGTYTVNLTVTNAGGSDSEAKTDYITVQVPLPPPPVAAFSATPLSGNAPLAVQFTDQSTGTVTSYAWDFTNDGTVESTSQSPIYTYSAAGTYTVKLTVTNVGGSDSEVKTDYITVQVPLPPPPVAAFSATPLSGNAPLAVQFTDQSTGTVTDLCLGFHK